MSNKPNQYVTLSRVVEAIEVPYDWDPEIEEYLDEDYIGIVVNDTTWGVAIVTLNGTRIAYPGDWIVFDAEGAFPVIYNRYEFESRYVLASVAIAHGEQGSHTENETLRALVAVQDEQIASLSATINGLVESVFNLVEGPNFPAKDSTLPDPYRVTSDPAHILLNSTKPNYPPKTKGCGGKQCLCNP